MCKRVQKYPKLAVIHSKASHECSRQLPSTILRKNKAWHYSLTCLKQPLKKTFIILPFVFKTFVVSIFEWPLKIGFTVHMNHLLSDNNYLHACQAIPVFSKKHKKVNMTSAATFGGIFLVLLSFVHFKTYKRSSRTISYSQSQ